MYLTPPPPKKITSTMQNKNTQKIYTFLFYNKNTLLIMKTLKSIKYI